MHRSSKRLKQSTFILMYFSSSSSLQILMTADLHDSLLLNKETTETTETDILLKGCSISLIRELLVLYFLFELIFNILCICILYFFHKIFK
jgi:hypothetical protein